MPDLAAFLSGIKVSTLQRMVRTLGVFPQAETIEVDFGEDILVLTPEEVRAEYARRFDA